MKEIGGYLELEHLISQEYYPDLVAVNNARNALIYLIRSHDIKRIYLPYFLCESVELACRAEGVTVAFYHIDKDLRPVFDKDLEEHDWLYLVNYYGMLSDEDIDAYKRQFRNLVVDNVQAFFQKPVNGVDTLYSCRKFFGVPDGGYVASSAFVRLDLQEDKSKDRMKHLLGRFEDGVANLYYGDFKANDAAFKTTELRYMSALTHNLLGAIDYDRAMRIRNENYRFLHNALGKHNALAIGTPDGPYAYPLYCKDGMKVKKALAERKIYVATLWPNVLSMDGSLEKDYAENILPLPCDQRYDQEDMQRIVDELLACTEFVQT